MLLFEEESCSAACYCLLQAIKAVILYGFVGQEDRGLTLIPACMSTVPEPMQVISFVHDRVVLGWPLDVVISSESYLLKASPLTALRKPTPHQLILAFS